MACGVIIRVHHTAEFAHFNVIIISSMRAIDVTRQDLEREQSNIHYPSVLFRYAQGDVVFCLYENVVINQR